MLVVRGKTRTGVKLQLLRVVAAVDAILHAVVNVKTVVNQLVHLVLVDVVPRAKERVTDAQVVDPVVDPDATDHVARRAVVNVKVVVAVVAVLADARDRAVTVGAVVVVVTVHVVVAVGVHAARAVGTVVQPQALVVVAVGVIAPEMQAPDVAQIVTVHVEVVAPEATNQVLRAHVAVVVLRDAQVLQQVQRALRNLVGLRMDRLVQHQARLVLITELLRQL